MAGTRRPPEADARDALIVGAFLGFMVGVVVGALIVGW